MKRDKYEAERCTVDGVFLTRGLLRGSKYSPDDPRGYYIAFNFKYFGIMFRIRLAITGKLHSHSSIWNYAKQRKFDSA